MQSQIANRKSAIGRALRWLHGVFHQHAFAAVVMLTAAPVGCAMLARGGRLGTVEASASASADVDARVEAAVSAALVQWKSEIENTLTTNLQTSLQASLQTRLGDNVGGDQSTTDSLTSVILAGGMVGLILLALTLFYRSRMSGAQTVSDILIGEIEGRRDRKPCNCGTCADCIVASLRERDGRVGKLVDKAVQRTVANHAIRRRRGSDPLLTEQWHTQ